MPYQISNQRRKQVWESMLTADLNYRYWGHLGRRYSKLDRTARVFLALTSSSTVASWGFLIEQEMVWKLLSALSAIIAVSLPVFNWQATAETIVELRTGWLQILKEYEMLWMRIEDDAINADELQTTIKQLAAQEVEFDHKVANLPNDAHLKQICQDEVIASRGL